MASYSLRTTALVLVAAGSFASAGCTAETTNCKSVSGTYQALYTPVGGNCGPIPNPYRVPIDESNSGNVTTIEKFATADVVTQVTMLGCTAQVVQTVEQGGMVKSRIDGDRIDIQNEAQLTGMVDIMHFDDNGQIMCQGRYNAVFTKSVVTIGAAAR